MIKSYNKNTNTYSRYYHISEIETALCSGNLGVEELTKLSKRLPELNEELDEKSMRWLELSEI